MAYDLEEQEQLAELKAWWHKYGNLVAGVFVVAAVLVVGYNLWGTYQKKQTVAAGAIYDQLQKAVAAKDAVHVREATGTLFDSYSRTLYAGMAALVSARFNVSEGDLKTAKAQLQWAIDHASDDSYRWIAKLRMAGIQLDEGTPDAALTTLGGEVPAPFQAAFADRRGDVYVVQNKPDAARKEYQSALDKINAPDADPGAAGYKAVLELKLDALNGGALVPPPAVAAADAASGASAPTSPTTPAANAPAVAPSPSTEKK